jgi:iron complex outermembrane recepter protein
MNLSEHSPFVRTAAFVVSGLVATTLHAAETSPSPGATNAPVRMEKMIVTGAAPAEYKVEAAETATKTDTPIMETPVSIQVVPLQVLEDQKVSRLDDALNNVSGVIRSNDSYGTGDSFSIRGFDQMESTYEDGLKLDQYTTSGLTRSTANIERIEVVKGPASVLFGRAEPGGLVNIVTKQPLDTPYYSVEQQAGSYAFFRTTADATGPLSADKTLLYRINLDYENSGSFRDFVYDRRFFLFPTLQWRPTDRDRVTAEFKYGTGTEVADNGLPFLPNGTPANVPITRNYAEPDANQSQNDEFYAKILATHAFNEDWQLRGLYKSEFHSAPALNSGYYQGDTDAGGNLNRYWFGSPEFQHWTHQVVADVTGHFDTWGARHTVVAGFDYYHQAGFYTVAQTSGTVPPINIYNPVYGQPFPPPDPTLSGSESSGQDAYGAYFQDQIALPGHVHLLGGFRYDNTTQFETGTFFTASTHDTPSPTPRFGVLWQAVPQLSLYASYTENFGATPLGSTPVPGRLLPPQSAQQFEAGVKTELLDKRLSITASVYDLTKENIPTADPANPAYVIAIGRARSRGLEFDISGKITEGWRVLGAYSYIDCVTTEDNNSPSLQGLRFPGVPYHSGSLWTTYDFKEYGLGGLKIGVGAIYRGPELAWEEPPPYTAYQADRIPGYTVVNAMASYAWRAGGTRLRAQLNVNNALDRRYFSALTPSQALPGAPLSFIGSLRAEF